METADIQKTKNKTRKSKPKVFKSQSTKSRITEGIKTPLSKPVKPIIKKKIIPSTADRSRIILPIFNKIVKQGTQLFNKLFNQFKNKQSTQTQQSQKDIKSLVSVLPSCHSSTTINTYLQNYAEFVEMQQQNYNNNLNYLVISVLATPLSDQLNTQLVKGYEPVSRHEFEKLFDPNSSLFISAVSQGTCALAERGSTDPKKYTADAQNLSNIYDLSKLMLQEIQQNKSIQPEFILEYIKNIKQVLRKDDYERYKGQFYPVYSENVQVIIENLEFLLQMFEYLKRTGNYDMSPYSRYIDNISKIYDYFTKLRDLIEEAKATEMFIIPEVGQIELTDLNGQKIIINNDIECLEVLLNIINALVTDPILGPEFNPPNQDLTDIIQRYETHIADWANGIPLYLANVGDDNDKFIMQNLLENVLWQIEPVESVNHDIFMTFNPNPDETLHEFDCQYGVNIMAAAKLCSSKSKKSKKCVVDFFGLSPYLKTTRTQASQKKIYELDIGASGTEILEDKTWRDLGIIKFFDGFLDMFLQNHITPENHNKTKMVIYLYLDKYVNNLHDHITKEIEILQKQQEKLEESRLKGEDVSAIANTIEEKEKYIGDTIQMGIHLENAKDQIYGSKADIRTIHSSINDLNFVDDELSRIYDFIKILIDITYYKNTYMSILKYYFQYLIGFDYAIYQLPSCRVLEDPSKIKVIPKRAQTSAVPLQAKKEEVLKKMGRFGGFKSRKLKYYKKMNSKRKTKKIRKRKNKY